MRKRGNPVGAQCDFVLGSTANPNSPPIPCPASPNLPPPLIPSFVAVAPQDRRYARDDMERYSGRVAALDECPAPRPSYL
jgi:hypothetical protein